MLGNTLRQTREARQLPLSEIEWATHIKAEHLAALEAEEFDRLPASVYARGYLRTYARYLGLDPEPLIAEYNASYEPASQIVSTRPAVTVQRKRFAVTPGLIAGLIMLAIAVAFTVYLKGQFDHYRASQAAATAPSPAVVLSPAAIVSPSPSPSPSASPSAGVACAGLPVVVKVDSPVWLRVTVDGKDSELTGGAAGKTIPANTTLAPFCATQTVEVRSGKAQHTFISVNSRAFAPMTPTEGTSIGDQTFRKGA